MTIAPVPCFGCLPEHQTPLYPKRHLVAMRNETTEPQDRLARQKRTLNPWILRQLGQKERFNVTPREQQ